MSRHVGSSIFCGVHDGVIDNICVDGHEFCTRCAADVAREKTGTVHNPWFFTGSPFGQEILALGLPELKVL